MSEEERKSKKRTQQEPKGAKRSAEERRGAQRSAEWAAEERRAGRIAIAARLDEQRCELAHVVHAAAQEQHSRREAALLPGV